MHSGGHSLDGEIAPIVQDKFAGSATAFAALRKGRPRVQLEWSDIRFDVPWGKNEVRDQDGDRKKVLQGISGSAKPGKCTAIMGASGAGKTSLLNVLGARIADGRANCKVSGEMKLNGVVMEPAEYAKRIAYVMQDDAILATTTVREALTFSARLRLPSTMPKADKLELVETMIEILGLTTCADTVVGDELIKGISGGERKRTAIGIELITSPDIIFLDEPTSGLDSYNASQVVSLLKQMAASGCTVLTTIHQPSSEVFFLFDNVTLLLKGGRLIYDASTTGLVGYLSTHGFSCPENHNPADYVMYQMQTKGKDGGMDLLVDAWTNSNKGKDATEEGAALDELNVGVEAVPTGFCEQLAILSKRELDKTIRDKATMGARMGMTVGLGALTGMIFWNAGDQTEATYDIQSHFGALFQMGIGAMFGTAQPLILTFPTERPVFLREYATGSYGAGAYFFSKLMVELPLTAVQSGVLTLLGWSMISLNGNFFVLWFAYFLLGLVSAGTAVLIGSTVANIKTAMEAAPAVFVPQMLFAGFYIKMEQIPVFLRWLQYICGLKWAMNIALANEFGTGRCQDLFKVNCARLLSANDVDEDLWWRDMLIMFGAFALFRILALAALKSKAKHFY